MKQEYISNYSDALLPGRSGLRDFFRDIVIKGLSYKLNPGHLERPRVQFLYIHHVFSDEEDSLRRLLGILSRQHRFIPYGKAAEMILSGSVDRPYIAFSADDGFKNNLRLGEILKEFDASACFFINPGITGETNIDVIRQYCSDKLQFPPVEFLNWNDIELLLKSGHEIGSHTMHHMNVAASSETAVTEDMQQAHAVLTRHCGIANHFAFPYGRFRHFSRTGHTAAMAAGFRTCASAERGCHINPPNPLHEQELCIRRDNVMLYRPLQQSIYFLVRNAKNAVAANNEFPASLR